MKKLSEKEEQEKKRKKNKEREDEYNNLKKKQASNTGLPSINTRRKKQSCNLPYLARNAAAKMATSYYISDYM